MHSVLPLHLILSLPNQLLAHVPITEVSATLTKLLEAGERSIIDDDAAEEEEPDAPELAQLFRPGQYVIGVVLATHIASNSAKEFTSLYPPTETIRLASKVEMSLIPAKANAGVLLDDMVVRRGKGKSKAEEAGTWKMAGEVKEEEDNGWRIDLGVEGVEGFLPNGKTAGGCLRDGASLQRMLMSDIGQTLQVGQLVDVIITQLASGSRIAQVSMDTTALKRATVSIVRSGTPLQIR